MQMLEESSLQTLKRAQASPEERKKMAERSFQNALKLLETAAHNGFEPKDLLLKAYRHLINAIQKDGQDPRYPCKMAYLLILIDCEVRARNYVGKALQLQPDYPEALALQEVLQKLMAPQPDVDFQVMCAMLEDQPPPRTEIEYDQLYEKVESFIQKGLQYFFQKHVPSELSFNENIVQAQQEIYHQLQDFTASVQTQFEILKEDLDILELEKMWLPVVTFSKRFAKVLQLNKQAQGLKQQIQSVIHNCCQFARQLQQDKSNGQSLEQNHQLETLYDQCDQIADQLDVLCEQYDIAPVLQFYERLIAQVESVQEILDMQLQQSH